MTIRNFTPDDAPEILDLWNTTLQKEKADSPWYVADSALTETRLNGIVSSPNFDPNGAFIAHEENLPVGFGWGIVKRVASYAEEKLDDQPGFLEGLLVKPAFRKKGIGAALLHHIETYVSANSKKTIRTSRYRSAVSGISVIPGTPEAEFLLKRGYRVESHEIKLRLNIRDFRLKEEILQTRDRLAQQGIDFRYYEPRDRDSFSRLMETYFQGWWYGSYRKNLESETPAPVLIALDGNRVIGFIGFVTVRENKRAGFSPGVDPEYRRRGIGNILVNLWGQAVKDLGAEESIISTGIHNHPAKRIYFEMGYANTGEFYAGLTKSLESP